MNSNSVKSVPPAMNAPAAPRVMEDPAHAHKVLGPATQSPQADIGKSAGGPAQAQGPTEAPEN